MPIFNIQKVIDSIILSLSVIIVGTTLSKLVTASENCLFLSAQLVMEVLGPGWILVQN